MKRKRTSTNTKRLGFLLVTILGVIIPTIQANVKSTLQNSVLPEIFRDASLQDFLHVDMTGRLHFHLAGPLTAENPEIVPFFVVRNNFPSWVLAGDYDLSQTRRKNLGIRRLLTSWTWRLPSESISPRPSRVQVLASYDFETTRPRVVEGSLAADWPAPNGNLSLLAKQATNGQRELILSLPLLPRFTWQGSLSSYRRSTVATAEHTTASWIPEIHVNALGHVAAHQHVTWNPSRPWKLDLSLRRRLSWGGTDATGELANTKLRVQLTSPVSWGTSARLETALEEPWSSLHVTVEQAWNVNERQ